MRQRRTDLKNYFDSETTENSVQMVLSLLDSIEDVEQFFNALPERIAFTPDLSSLRLSLSSKAYAKILHKVWLYSQSDESEREIIEYLQSTTSSESNVPHWIDLPRDFLERPKVWKIAPLFVKLLHRSNHDEFTSHLRDDLLASFDAGELTQSQIAEIMYLLPDEIMHDLDFFKYLSPKQQIQALFEQDNINERMITLISHIMEELNSSDLHEVIWKLPTAIKLNKLVFPLLPPKEQTQALLEQGDLEEQEITTIIQNMTKLNSSDLIDVIPQLPTTIKLDKLVFPLLPPKEQIQALSEQDPINNEMIMLIVQVMEELDYSDLFEITENLPADILENWIVIPHIPSERKLEVILSKLPVREEELGDLANIIDTFEAESRQAIIDQMPAEHLKHPTIFSLLDDKQQQILFWTEINHNNLSNWDRMSEIARLLTIFRATKEKVDFDPTKTGEEHPILQACLNIYWAVQNPNNAQKAINKAHDLITDYVCEIAWDLDEDLNLFGNYPYDTGILPPCSAGVVRYCEGREWFTEAEKKKSSKVTARAFCPRLGGPCGVNGIEDAQSYYYSGARLYPQPNLPWEEWSLFELLQMANVHPNIDGADNLGDYITKLSGWLNRLHEIRQRLRCSVCNEAMKPNMQYAKNLARYRVTVVSCNHGTRHDENIYLNHCWGCYAIIDSRESSYQIDGYYVCIHCGSGSRNHPTYRQGDMCPKCGTQKMVQSDDNERRFTCSNTACNHNIRTPLPNRLTGMKEEDSELDSRRRLS